MSQQICVISLLRLLLDSDHPSEIEGAELWSDLHPLAARNGVLLRLAGQLQRNNAFPADALTIVAAEQRRAEKSFRLVGRVADACIKHGIEGVFISAVQHHPDIGLDIDLLVLDRSLEAGAAIAHSVGLRPVTRGIRARLAAAATYESPDEAVPLDIHHARLGVAGEHHGFPMALVAGREAAVVEGQGLFVPSAGDQIVLQGMLRVYGRRSVRLADLYHTMAAIRRCQFDWHYIVEQAREFGILPGLACYLDYLEQLNQKMYGTPLLNPITRAALGRSSWGEISLDGGALRFPVARVSAYLYLRQFASQARRGDWSGAGRSCLIPALAAAATVRRIKGPAAAALLRSASDPKLVAPMG